jgi:hypothetical protein
MKPNTKIARLKKQLKELASQLNQAQEENRASQATAATLQDSLDKQTETSRRLRAENEELKASQLNTTEADARHDADKKIESLARDVAAFRQARADVLQFVLNTFVVAPGAAADTMVEDNPVTIVETTKKQLQWCELARDHTRSAQQTVTKQLRKIQGGYMTLVRQAKQNAKLQADLQKLVDAARRWAAWKDVQIAALEYDYARADAAVEEWQDRHVRYVQAVMDTLNNQNF